MIMQNFNLELVTPFLFENIALKETGAVALTCSDVVNRFLS